MDENGVLSGANWGYCGPECPHHPDDNIRYLEDKTLKMSLQYDNTELIMNMINVYSFLITGILILFLVLTILLPATGQTLYPQLTKYEVPLNSSHDDYEVREVRAQYPPS